MATTQENLYKCPFITTQKLLNGKWSIVILHHLATGTKRFNELHRQMEDVTQATLTKQLRYLEDQGLINREIYPQVPPKVEYSLTPIGEQFKTVLDSIEAWGNAYIQFYHTKHQGVEYADIS